MKKSFAFAFSALAITATAQAEPVAVTGFVDAAYRTRSVLDSSQRGFFINDGALYLDHKSGDSEMKLDIPFSTGTTTLDGVNNSFASNTINLFQYKGQAYIGYKLPFGVRMKVGQFDALFGYEANDSVERKFSGFDLVSYSFLSFTHSGVNFGYDLPMGISIDAVVGNSTNSDSSTFSNPGGTEGADRKHEMGIIVSYKNAMFHGGVGYKSDDASLVTDREKNDKTLMVLAGVNIDKATADVEFYNKKYETQDDAATGVAVHVNYAATEALGLSARYSTVSKNNFFNMYSANDLGLGMQYAATKDLSIHADYYQKSVKATSTADSVNSNQGTVNFIHKF